MPENNKPIDEIIPNTTELPIPEQPTPTSLAQEIESGEEPVFENPLPEEKKELTEEEKRELYINQLKEARVRFHPIKHKGNITTNQFPISYKKERRRKNKIQRQSRKGNR
jgi:hypothetical protein